jgi:hypothetical protein
VRLQTGSRLQQGPSLRAFEPDGREETGCLKKTALLIVCITRAHMHLLETDWRAGFASLRQGDAESGRSVPDLWPQAGVVLIRRSGHFNQPQRHVAREHQPVGTL